MAKTQCECGVALTGKQVFCSDTCRMRAHRARANPVVTDKRWFSRAGFVYVISCEGSLYYKIGITRNNPKDRLSALQTGCPHRLSLYMIAPVMNMEEVEATLHKWIDSRRVNGEGFDLSDCMEAVRLLSHIEANYYESKLVWLASCGAVDITGMVRTPYNELNPYVLLQGYHE